MNLERTKYLAALRREIQHLEQAILALQQLHPNPQSGAAGDFQYAEPGASAAGYNLSMRIRFQTGDQHQVATWEAWQPVSFGLFSQN
jgi:hypothetical protein